jgi:hypothetical protein
MASARAWIGIRGHAVFSLGAKRWHVFDPALASAVERGVSVLLVGAANEQHDATLENTCAAMPTGLFPLVGRRAGSSSS